jgi:hypothetical protein
VHRHRAPRRHDLDRRRLWGHGRPDAEADPLGVEDLATHYLPLSQAPYGYRIFSARTDGAIKVLLQPGLG